MSETNEIVVSSVKERFGWGNPEQIYIFKTETGINVGCRFLCRVENIPEQIRKVVEALKSL
jgi:hypothetical protein